MPCPLVWDVPLDAPPDLVMIDRNVHGYQAVDRFRLRDLWSLHLYGYDATLLLDGVELAIRPGTIALTPPGVLSEYRYRGLSAHIYAHFRLPPGPGQSVDALQDLGDHHEEILRRLEGGVALFSRQPKRVEARLWDVLWDVASLSRGADRSGAPSHRAVRFVCDAVERHLGEPLSVENLAQAVDISPSYLARLFQKEFGESVVGYIRRRRLERADYLLQHSRMTIKEIALVVGIPDLQHFNKAVRAQFGMSPRARRALGSAEGQVRNVPVFAPGADPYGEGVRAD